MKKQEFKIGDEVIALTNPKDDACQPRKKGNKYRVTSILYCIGCGTQTINLDGQLTEPRFNHSLKCSCGKETDTKDNYHYTISDLFIKPQDISEVIKEHEQIEDYEFCAVLRSIQLESK